MGENGTINEVSFFEGKGHILYMCVRPRCDTEKSKRPFAVLFYYRYIVYISHWRKEVKMNERRYLMLKELLEIKRADAIKQEAGNEKIIKETLTSIISMENVDIGVDDYCSYGWRVELAIINNEGEQENGCGCTIYYEPKNKYRDRKFEIRYGSGNIDKNYENYKNDISRIEMLYKLSQALEEIEQMFDNLKIDKVKDYQEADIEIEWAKGDLLDKYKEQIEKGLAIDKEYEIDNRKMTVNKITPKFVFFDKGGLSHKMRKSEFLREQANIKFEEFEAQHKEQEEDVE